MVSDRSAGHATSARTKARAGNWVPVASRFAGALVGGYVFTFGFVALMTLAGFALGLRYFVAQTLAWLVCFLVYLAAILWGFAERSLARVWIVLGGGGSAMAASAWLLSQQWL